MNLIIASEPGGALFAWREIFAGVDAGKIVEGTIQQLMGFTAIDAVLMNNQMVHERFGGTPSRDVQIVGTGEVSGWPKWVVTWPTVPEYFKPTQVPFIPIPLGPARRPRITTYQQGYLQMVRIFRAVAGFHDEQGRASINVLGMHLNRISIRMIDEREQAIATKLAWLHYRDVG